jgi:uncharacterized protein YacL
LVATCLRRIVTISPLISTWWHCIGIKCISITFDCEVKCGFIVTITSNSVCWSYFYTSWWTNRCTDTLYWLYRCICTVIFTSISVGIISIITLLSISWLYYTIPTRSYCIIHTFLMIIWSDILSWLRFSIELYIINNFKRVGRINCYRVWLKNHLLSSSRDHIIH